MKKNDNVVSDQVRHKLSCLSTGDGYRLEILDVQCRGIVAKTKSAEQLRGNSKAGLRLCFRIYILFISSYHGSFPYLALDLF